jgi:hypothetical protein
MVVIHYWADDLIQNDQGLNYFWKQGYQLIVIRRKALKREKRNMGKM